jgi:hypothetical protein
MSSRSAPFPAQELQEMPGVARWMQDVNKHLGAGGFTPETTDIGTVTASRGIYQQVGHLMFFHMELIGNLSIDPASDTVTLPYTPLHRKDDVTETMHGSNTIVFTTFEGAYLNRGYIIAGTNTIKPEATVADATGITVQGYYWINN